MIGEINPLTGALALQGTTVHQGIVLAIGEQNARGGIPGRRLILLFRDDEARAERGDPVSCERVILQIQDGRHVVVRPKERAQAAAR